jgi:hypothetical protein
MPRFDGTGPRGEGPFTGRAEGYCAIRLPEPGSGQPATGFAGLAGSPVELRAKDSHSLLRWLDLSGPSPTRGLPCGHGLRRGRSRHNVMQTQNATCLERIPN